MECYSGALELVGRTITVDEAIQEVLKDRPFYETSGGGMTLSGGEPTYQIAFAEALLRTAKQEGVHTCIETCGYTDYERLERLRPYVDQFLYDLKETNPQRHLEYTGVSNDRILDNLRELAARGASIALRCPIIPGYNDRQDHFDAIAVLAHELPGLLGVELMPYHTLGEGKLERLGLGTEDRAQAQTPSSAAIAEWTACLRAQGVHILNEE